MNNKVSNSQQRIKELMNYYNINQTELCKRTGIQKSALSNYLNGDREPRQKQVSLLADPFNVNPAWLMGYDVPMFLNEVNANEAYEHLLVLYERNIKIKELIDLYLNVPADIQDAVVNLLKAAQLPKQKRDIG